MSGTDYIRLASVMDTFADEITPPTNLASRAAFRAAAEAIRDLLGWKKVYDEALKTAHAENFADVIEERDRLREENRRLCAVDPGDFECDARRDVCADLRAYADAHPENDGTPCVYFAADEIERLRARNALLAKEVPHA